MQKTVKSKAEEKYAAILKKDQQAMADRDQKRLVEAAHVAKLRGLRLAKQAADKEAAELAETAKKEAAKPATKPKKKAVRAVQTR